MTFVQQIIVRFNLSLRSYKTTTGNVFAMIKTNMMRRKLYTLFFYFVSLGFCFGQNHKCGYDFVQQRLMQQSPEYRNEVNAYTQEVLPGFSQNANSRTLPVVITIPVVVHVIHTGQAIGAGANLSMDRVLSQIEILNEDYRRTNNDTNQTPDSFQDVAADTEIQFCVANIDPDGNQTTGITRHVYSNITDIDDIENTIKPETTWDPDRYMNIWTIEMPSSTILGYSYLPTTTMVGSDRDGIVINYTNYGYINEQNRGRTCVHEVGHYMGLQHIWGGTDSNGDPIGCGSDDGAEDTPTSSSPHFGCPNFGTSSCTSTDMFMNFMEYVNDDCMNLFTEDQKTIMQGNLNGIRAQLAENALTACGETETSCKDLSVESIEMGFEVDNPLNGWEIENANGDIKTWLVSQSSQSQWGPNTGQGLAVYLWNASMAADDYLFTPCIDLEANHTYRVKFSYACAEDNNGLYVEAFEVGFSAQQSSADFTVPNDDWVFDFVNNAYPDYNDHSLTFETTDDGTYSLGFHVFSDANQFALQIDDILIEDMGMTSDVQDIPASNIMEINPNPTSGEINLALDFENSHKKVTIHVFDILGREVSFLALENVLKTQTALDLTHLEEGIYFVSINTSNFMLTEKIILAK